jgi:hypothetical protein
LNAIYEAACDLQGFCENRDWRFCFIGGIAVLRWGDARATQDADLTLITGFGNEVHFIDPLLKAFAGRDEDPRGFALAHRVLLLKHGNGVPMDVALGAIPFEENSIRRSSLWKCSRDYTLRTCSAEDLVVHKAFAGRPIDWIDIERVLQRQGKLDTALIRCELAPLAEAKEEPEILSRLNRLFVKHHHE